MAPRLRPLRYWCELAEPSLSYLGYQHAQEAQQCFGAHPRAAAIKPTTTGPTTLVQVYSRFNPDWDNLTVCLPTFSADLAELCKAPSPNQQLTQQTIDIQQISQTMAG